MKYRKKPIVVEAEQLVAGRTLSSTFHKARQDTFKYTEDGTLLIQTLEGVMEARPGDWIIKGVAGEFYPCKPEIFAQTYEPVERTSE
jgi:hypothetical protein